MDGSHVGRLTEAQYDRQREEVRQLYGDSSAEAVAKRDQALAALFARSGWTQEELARKEGKERSYIARRLTFGRFLSFVSIGTNAQTLPTNLTEGRFRKYWEAAGKHGGNDQQRSMAALKAIQADVRSPMLPRSRHDVGPRIVEAFADGKWHDEQTIIDRFPDDDPEVVRNRLRSMQSIGIYDTRAEREKYGRGHRVRLFKQDRLISSSEISSKLRPLIEGLKQEGKKNVATVSIGSVARLAALLERQVDEWTQDPAANEGGIARRAR